MTNTPARGPDQGDADRHHQLHRLPGVPGGLQAVERARGRGDRVGARTGLPEPGDAQREDATRSSHSTKWRTRRSRAA